MDLAASIQAVTEEVVLRLTRSIAAETGAQESLPGRRRRAQLRRQRQGPARRPLRADLGAAGRGRRRRRARRGAGRLSPLSQRAARCRNALDGMQGLSRPAFTQAEIERRLAAAARVFEVIDEAELLDATARR